MFKKASMKLIARDSTASNVGNHDTKPMHTLISAEKVVLLSLQKLASDMDKATEALKAWGSSEKDDLGGVLTASTSLLHHFSLALSQYISTGHTMQRQLEAMSTRGDSLDNLRQRRNSAHRKAEDTAVQLKKMSPENKYYAMHTEALKCLRKDVRRMDADIKLEDATFGDFKRTTTKVWMTLKFGGLHDCCQKGMIAGKYGKLATTEISEETAQPGMARSPYSPAKVDNLLAEADRHINAVGHSVAARQSLQISQESSNASPTDSPISPQRSYQEPSMFGPPQPPPKSQSHYNDANYDQAIQPSHNGNGHLSERVDHSAAPSSVHRPYGPPHQPQLSVNSSGGYSLQDSSVGRRRPTIGSSFPESMAGPSHFQGPPPNQFPVQKRPPGSSESGGYSSSQPSLGGRGNPSISEGMSHPQDSTTTRSLGAPRKDDSSYPLSSGGRHLNSRDLSFSAATPHWQNPPFDQYLTPSRPPAIPESGRYPPQDSPSLGGRSDSSHWQNSPADRFATPPRPPGSSDSGGPSPDASPVNGRYRSDSSFSEGPSQWQNPPPRPPASSESGRYPVQDPPSSGQPHRVNNPSFSAGSSHSRNSPPDRLPVPQRVPIPPRPPLSESRRHPAQDPPHVGGRNLSGYSSSEKSHSQGAIVMTPHDPSDSRGHALQDPRTASGRRPDDHSFSETTAGPSQWTTNRFNGHRGPEVSVASEGMTRPREGSYSHQHHVDAWGGATDPDDSPPAYRDDYLGHHESLPDAAGHFSAPPPPGSRGGSGRW